MKTLKYIVSNEISNFIMCQNDLVLKKKKKKKKKGKNEEDDIIQKLGINYIKVKLVKIYQNIENH